LDAQPHIVLAHEHHVRVVVDVRCGLSSEAELRQILKNYFGYRA
jgi:hypothetical protein